MFRGRWDESGFVSWLVDWLVGCAYVYGICWMVFLWLGRVVFDWINTYGRCRGRLHHPNDEKEKKREKKSNQNVFIDATASRTPDSGRRGIMYFIFK